MSADVFYPRTPHSSMPGAVELGGTHTVVAMGCAGKVMESESFPTSDFEATMETICRFLEDHELEAVGVAAFGPVVVNPRDPRYGTVLRTPKPGWSSHDMHSQT